MYGGVVLGLIGSSTESDRARLRWVCDRYIYNTKGKRPTQLCRLRSILFQSTMFKVGDKFSYTDFTGLVSEMKSP